MNSPAHDTAMFLGRCWGFGQFGGSGSWPIYVGREPRVPDNVVTVYDTGGGPAVKVPDLRDPTVQVRVRGDDYSNAWAKANQAYEFLTQEIGYPIDEGLILSWLALGDINYIGREEEKDRPLFTLNLSVLRDGRT